METEFLTHINDAFALLKDPLQYIVARPRKGKKASWTLVSYNRHGREALLRDLKRRGIVPTPEALSYIEMRVPSWKELFGNREPADELAPIGR